jgi:uncharacterized protein (TIGR03086 family)
MPDVELIDAASAQFERVVRQLPADSWDRPTPSDLSVRELVEHVVVGNRFTALLLAGVQRDEARTMLIGDQDGDDPVAAVVESARRQAEAFAATPPGQPVAGPNGNIPADAFLRFRLVDLVVHAWDLLRAARLDETLDPRIVVSLLKVVEPHLDDMLALGRTAQARAAPCLPTLYRRLGCSTGSDDGPSRRSDRSADQPACPEERAYRSVGGLGQVSRGAVSCLVPPGISVAGGRSTALI